MTKFYSPYQFIPVDPQKINKDLVEWQHGDSLDHPTIRHDRWVKDSISATIHCTLSTLTPLAVGRKQGEASEDKPADVTPYTYNGRPAIPANSLRGMIASIIETISQSSMRVLTAEQDSHASVRKLIPPQGEALTEIGLLIKKDERYYIYPLGDKHNIKRVKPNQTELQQQTYQHSDNPSLFYATTKGTVASELSTLTSPHTQSGVLYHRGGVGIEGSNKTWESFIPWDGNLAALENKKISVSPEIIEQLESILIQRHNAQEEPKVRYLPKGYQERAWQIGALVKSGDLLYYKKDKHYKASELSYSSIWRRPVGNTYQGIKKLLGENALPWNSDRTHITPAEALFGVIEEATGDNTEAHRNLASRVHFHDAIAGDNVNFSEKWITLKKLDSPKPPSPAMYYSAANGSFVSKEKLDLDKHKPNGRKHYPPQPSVYNEGIKPWETKEQYHNKGDQKLKENWKQHLRIKPVSAGSEFSFTLKVENLSAAEFGLLLTGLEPAPDNRDFIHRLGMGKPYGLGQVRIDIDKIAIVNRHHCYSLEGLKAPRATAYPNDKAKRNTDLIDTIAWDELQTLANPAYSQDHPVCYPFTTQQKAYNEEKAYEWFTRNQKVGGHDYLKKITINKALPKLDSN